jgi:hypothetical protein
VTAARPAAWATWGCWRDRGRSRWVSSPLPRSGHAPDRAPGPPYPAPSSRCSPPTTTTPFVTDRQGTTLELEADHRRHAEVENTIRDLKYGVGLNHLPSGKFAANAAWLTLTVIVHNLARWTSRIGLGETLITTKTLRTRYLALPGRLTRSARRLHLHLPTRWPWASGFLLALDRLRCVPFPTPS